MIQAPDEVEELAQATVQDPVEQLAQETVRQRAAAPPSMDQAIQSLPADLAARGARGVAEGVGGILKAPIQLENAGIDAAESILAKFGMDPARAKSFANGLKVVRDSMSPGDVLSAKVGGALQEGAAAIPTIPGAEQAIPGGQTAGKVAESVGNAVPLVAAGIATGGALVPAALMGAAVGGAMHEEATKAGRSPGERAAATGAATALGGLVGLLELGPVLKGIGKPLSEQIGKNIVAQIALGAGSGALGQTLQGTLTEAIRDASLRDESAHKTFESWANELGQQAISEGVPMGIVGGILAGTVAATRIKAEAEADAKATDTGEKHGPPGQITPATQLQLPESTTIHAPETLPPVDTGVPQGPLPDATAPKTPPEVLPQYARQQTGAIPEPAAAAPETLGEATQEPATPNSSTEAAATDTVQPSRASEESGGAVPPETVSPPSDAIGIRHADLEAKREELGLEPADKRNPVPDLERVERVQEKIKADPDYGRKLIDELALTDRVANEDEKVAFAFENAKRANAASKALAEFNADPTPANEEASRLADEDYTKLYKVVKEQGSKGGGLLRLQQAMVAQDETWAGVQARAVAANKGNPLDARKLAEQRGFHAQLEAAKAEIEKYAKENQQLRSDAELRKAVEQVERKTARKPKTPSHVREFLSEQAAKARARIEARSKFTRMHAGGVETQEIIDWTIIGAEKIAIGAEKFADWSRAMVADLGEAVQPHLATIYAKAHEIADTAGKTASRVKARNTRAEKSIAEITDRLARDDYSAQPKRESVPLDTRGEKLQAELERVRGQLKSSRERYQREHAPLNQKIQRAAVKLSRAFVLTSPAVVEKLAAAAAWRLVTRPMEQAVGKLLPKGLTERSPHEGHVSASIEMQAYSKGVVRAAKEAWANLKNKPGQTELVYGDGHNGARTPLEYIGSLHQALHQPALQVEFERQFANELHWAESQGLDTSNPAVVMRAGVGAWKYAQRATFLQDNIVVDGYRAMLGRLRANDPKTGKPNPSGVLAANGLEAAIPVVKIPTNAVAEAVEFITGSVTGSAKLALAYKHGIENLSPVQADNIARALKKGTLGALGLAIGAMASDKIGGYWRRDKKEKGAVDAGDIKIGDATVPHTLLHSPLIEAVNVAATAMHVLKSPKSDEGDALKAAALGLIDETPFSSATMNLGEAVDANNYSDAAAKLIAERATPQAVQWAARHFDTDSKGEPIKRKAKGLVENIEAGIPGLRSNLPKK